MAHQGRNSINSAFRVEGCGKVDVSDLGSSASGIGVYGPAVVENQWPDIFGTRWRGGV